MDPIAQGVAQGAGVATAVGAAWLAKSAGSKGLGKLLEVVAEQLGSLTAPYHTRRMAEAEADAKVTAAGAATEVKLIEGERKWLLKEQTARAEERVRQREARRQRNIEAVAEQASEALPESVSDRPVDPDWVTEFFNHCQDVSDDLMQKVWGKLLAGEVAEPGRFSLRTLASLKLLTKAEGEAFARLCSMVWHFQDYPTLVMPWADFQETPWLTCSRAEMHLLADAGLVIYPAPGDHIHRSYGGVILAEYFGTEFVITAKGGPPGKPPPDFQLRLGSLGFTKAGAELAPLTTSGRCAEYLEATLSHYRRTYGLFVVERGELERQAAEERGEAAPDAPPAAPE